jgi:hypothetical protein
VPQPLPIACSLSAGDQRRRLQEMASLADHVLGVEPVRERGSRVRFRAAAGVEAALRRIVDAERECCPFLDLSLSVDGPDLALFIGGPQEAAPMIREIAEALAGRQAGTR